MNFFKAFLCFLLMAAIIGTVLTQDLSCAGNVGLNSFPDPITCNAYFLCFDETAIPMTCNENLIFDIFLLKCNFPELSVCLPNLLSTTTAEVTSEVIEVTTLSPTTTSTTTIVPTTTIIPTASSTATTSAIITTQSTEIPRPNEEPTCPDRGLHFYPHMSDCHRYYKCFYGRLYVMSCLFSLVWNQNILFCDFRWNVACSGA
ncbi:endochitinase-like [Armigeres subalbatus]|uniref:endochitinase-like n=1 Tax=Armigeres subalbatus TaxID=124917 RepID=UPI002ED5D43F